VIEKTLFESKAAIFIETLSTPQILRNSGERSDQECHPRKSAEFFRDPGIFSKQYLLQLRVDRMLFHLTFCRARDENVEIFDYYTDLLTYRPGKYHRTALITPG
jgi:hypothetical protein